MLTRLIAALLALLIIAAPVSPVMAAEDEVPQLGIAPVGVEGNYFSLELEAGVTRELKVALSNLGTQEAAARTYAADAYTIINGGFGARLAGEPVSGTTTWLDYEASTLDIAPGTAVVRTFNVTVPDDAGPGEFLTSLVIENAEPVKGTGAVTLNHVIRQVIAVAITIPGERTPALEIGAAQHKAAGAVGSILVEVKNTGNTHLKPSGEFVLTDTGGEVLRQPIAMDSFYAGTETFVEVQMIEPLAAGDYEVQLSLADEAHDVAVESGQLPFRVDVAMDQPALPPVSITSITVNELRDGNGALQYVEPIVTIQNDGASMTGGEVALHVTRDGIEVETFVLGTSLTFAEGETEVRQRYLPPGGWVAGTYRFTVTISGFDPRGNQNVLLDEADPVTPTIVE